MRERQRVVIIRKFRTVPAHRLFYFAEPDGSYTVTAWHEGFKNHSKPVTASGDATIEFTLTK